MSINPARTVASAVVTRPWSGVWVYLLAPTLGMLGAGQAFAWVSARPARTAKLAHDNCVCCVFPATTMAGVRSGEDATPLRRGFLGTSVEGEGGRT